MENLAGPQKFKHGRHDSLIQLLESAIVHRQLLILLDGGGMAWQCVECVRCSPSNGAHFGQDALRGLAPYCIRQKTVMFEVWVSQSMASVIA